MLKDIKKESKSQVCYLINNLTNNEDYRQELWVHYLSGNSPSSFSSHLENVKTAYTEHTLLQNAIWTFINDSSHSEILDIIVDFSEFEKSIIILLIIGLDVEAISRYKNISETRIRQAVHSIRCNNIWKSFKVSR